MFHEFTRPYKVFKNQIMGKINVFSMFNKMAREAKEESETASKSKHPPVAKGVSKSEFKGRYRGVCIYSCILIFFISYTLLFFLASLNLVAYLVSGAVFVFLFIKYVFALHKAWLARYYFRNWDSRFTHANLSFRDFIDSIIIRKRLLLPVFDINFKEDL